MPANALPLLFDLRVVGIEGLGEPVGAWVEHRREADVGHDRDRSHDQDHGGHEQRSDGGDLDVASLDLLAEVLRRAADHQPGDEHGDDDVEEHAVQTGADAPEDHLAGEHVRDRYSSAAGGEGVMPADYRSVRRVRRGDGPEPRVGYAETDLLVGHVAAALAVTGREVHP